MVRDNLWLAIYTRNEPCDERVHRKNGHNVKHPNNSPAKHNGQD